ncbi:MAG: surface-adhesin E family protein [Burkholderiaceae bacterium]
MNTLKALSGKVFGWHQAVLSLMLMVFLVSGLQAQVTLRMVGDDKDRSRHYVDIDRVEINGDIRGFWRTVDLPQRDFVGAMSLRHRQEINCKAETIRTIVTTHHQGIRGTGPIIITLPAQDRAFQPISPENIDPRVATLICQGQFQQRVLRTKSAKPKVDADGNPIPEEEAK